MRGEDFGSWKQNCNQKPRLLERMREEIAGPIVWLDADCVIHSKPLALLQNRSEDAVLFRGGATEKHYVSSQVMWWNDTVTARGMIADWSKRSKADPESLADPLLKSTCEEWRDVAKIGVLPEEYYKSYWKPVPRLKSRRIVISTNERRSTHPDAVPRQNRVRLDPLRLPYGS